MHKKERIGILWLKAGFWKLRRIRRGSDRGRFPPCLGEMEAKHIMLKCPETKKWREELVCNKWLNINEDIAYRKIIICNNVTKLKVIGNYLFKTKCKWETEVKGDTTPPPEVSWKQKCKVCKWIESRSSNGAVVVVSVVTVIVTVLI
jgi:hypothetical protein